ncbi:MAG: clostripain-related cysteine peptidase [Candidatus Muirbacterium halophilum]|nr:clostripain-related cysteine peptidase [Candidatus Muirbacterium halophilum]MCK9474981.1 clostripain-related cysteine peptidase [Candidatus Muirbacterium halophilum]
MVNKSGFLILISALIFIFIGCGGGGGSSSTNTDVTENILSGSMISGYINTDGTSLLSSVKCNGKSPFYTINKNADLSGISVTLKGTDRTTVTNSEGYFELFVPEKYSNGLKTIVINKAGTDMEDEFDITLSNGKRNFLDIKMQKSSNIWNAKYNLFTFDYEEYSNNLISNYNLWSQGYLAHYSVHSPDSYWKYSGKDGIFMKSNFRYQNTVQNNTYELFVNADMQDQLNNGTFMANIYSSNPPDSDYMVFDNSGKLYGIIMIRNKQSVGLTLSESVDFYELYDNRKIGKRLSFNILFNEITEAMGYNEILLGFEDVSVKAGEFEDCAKIMTKYDDGSYSISYYARNVGEVKNQEFTESGVLEDYCELTDYYIQKTDLILPLSQKEWTIMYYACADDSLTSDLTIQIIENEFSDLLNSGSDENINIVFQMEPSRNNGLLSALSGYYQLITNFTAYIEKDNIVNLRKNMSMNVGDPANLVEFVNYSKTNFPAKKYALVYSGHGAGSIYNKQSLLAPERVIGIASSYNDFLSYQEINSAFSQITSILGKKLSLTVLDACLMSTMEMTYELREYTDYILASKFTTIGNKYSDAFSWLKSNTQSNGLELAKKIAGYTYDYYSQVNQTLTLAVTDPSYMNIFFMDKIRAFVNEVKDNQNLLAAFQTVNVLNNSSLFERGFSSPQIDFFEFVKFFNNPYIYGADLVNSAESLLSYKDLLIPYKVNNNLYYYDLDYNLRTFSDSGISIFWPYYTTNQSLQILKYGNYINNTLTPKFNTDTGWSTIF